MYHPIHNFLYRIHDTPSLIRYCHSYCYDTYSDTFLYRFLVLKVTPCGAWIKYENGKKFVLLDATKRFAHENVELAKDGFERRKAAQLRIMNARIRSITDKVNAISDVKYDENTAFVRVD